MRTVTREPFAPPVASSSTTSRYKIPRQSGERTPGVIKKKKQTKLGKTNPERAADAEIRRAKIKLQYPRQQNQPCQHGTTLCDNLCFYRKTFTLWCSMTLIPCVSGGSVSPPARWLPALRVWVRKTSLPRSADHRPRTTPHTGSCPSQRQRWRYPAGYFCSPSAHDVHGLRGTLNNCLCVYLTELTNTLSHISSSIFSSVYIPLPVFGFRKQTRSLLNNLLFRNVSVVIPMLSCSMRQTLQTQLNRLFQ